MHATFLLALIVLQSKIPCYAVPALLSDAVASKPVDTFRCALLCKAGFATLPLYALPLLQPLPPPPPPSTPHTPLLPPKKSTQMNLFLDYLTSKQDAQSVSGTYLFYALRHGDRRCRSNCLTQSLYTDTGRSCPSIDPMNTRLSLG